MQENSHFCTFYLERLLFGIELRRVQEVMRRVEMTRVPLAPPAVSGLINLRGQIVTAIDLRRRLGLSACTPEIFSSNVVVRTEDGAVSFLVDEIGDVIEAGPASFEPPPETVHPAVRSVILGVHKLNDRLLHVLNTERASGISDEVEPGGLAH